MLDLLSLSLLESSKDIREQFVKAFIMAEEIVTQYNKVLIIIDACEEPGNEDTFPLMSIHYQKQKIVRRTFEKCFDGDVHNVIFPPRTRVEAVIDHIEGICLQIPSDEVAMIYYHGASGEIGTQYIWEGKRQYTTV